MSRTKTNETIFNLCRIQLCVVTLIIIGILSNTVFSQVSSTNITRLEALASLRTNRNRLLSTYALQNNYANANQAWSAMTASQKGVFLTVTDYLGRRSLTHYNENYQINYVGDEDDQGFGCTQLNDSSADYRNDTVYVHPINYYGPSCLPVNGQSCAEMGKCVYNYGPRTDYDMVLNHVTKFYAINGSNGSSCGGGDYNRIFFSADDELIYLIRNITLELGLPTWDRSYDPLGPHSPFTQSREGIEGKPRGQMHNWAWDYQASVLARPGVYGVYDPHIVEMDIDYTAYGHPSNPECYYNGVYGRIFYENYWFTRGLYGSAELNYSPPNKN
jgi:hypothetical protein